MTTFKERYWSDPAFREKQKKRCRDAKRKNYKAFPEFYRQKSREYRKNNPDAFNRTMAKIYLRKLSKEVIKKVLKEVGYDGSKRNN